MYSDKPDLPGKLSDCASIAVILQFIAVLGMNLVNTFLSFFYCVICFLFCSVLLVVVVFLLFIYICCTLKNFLIKFLFIADNAWSV